jgi:pimeloyl-ACP methyl ester carboxylesterase
MAAHAQAFLDGLGLKTCDVLGFSLGGMVAQQMALDRTSVFRRIVLVGTAPRGGEDMHLDKPSLAKHLADPNLKGYAVLQKIFFAPTESSQAAGARFIDRLMLRKGDREPVSGQEVAQAQMAAFRDWEQYSGGRFALLRGIWQPTLVVNGVHDEMIPVRNSYWLSENLPNAVLLTYPDSGHGSSSSFMNPSLDRRLHFSLPILRLRRIEDSKRRRHLATLSIRVVDRQRSDNEGGRIWF